MAGGLGTRMRSAVPKHFHPLLGRPMVDWIIAAGRDAGADPFVVVASPSTRDEFGESGVDGRRAGRAARHRRRRSLGAGRARGIRRRRARPLRRHAAARRPTCCESSSRRTAREGADATILQRRASRPAALRPRRPRRRRHRAHRIVEGTDASDDEQKIREINSSIYVFRAEALWPALERLEPKNVQGELYLTDAIEHPRRAAATRSPRTSPPTHRETDGVNTRVELAHAGAVLRDRINERHMLAGVTIVDPQTTWIEPTVELEPDVDDPSVHGAARRDARRDRRRDRRRTPSRSTPHRRRRDVGPFCYLRPGRSSATPPRRAPSWRSRTHASATARRCPTCRTSATPRSATTRTSAPGAITANFPHQPGRAEGPDDDRQQRQDRYPQWLRRARRDRGRSMDCSRIGDHQGCPRRRARDRPAAPGEQGGLCSPCSATSELVLPGLELARRREPAEAGPLDRARAAEAADGLLRPLAHRPRPADRASSSASSSARSSVEHVRERRDVRAATTSRSAAPTSSSSRPAASRSTGT